MVLLPEQSVVNLYPANSCEPRESLDRLLANAVYWTLKHLGRRAERRAANADEIILHNQERRAASRRLHQDDWDFN